MQIDFDELYAQALVLIELRTGFAPGKPFISADGLRMCEVAGGRWNDRQIVVLAWGEAFAARLFPDDLGRSPVKRTLFRRYRVC